MDIRTGSPNPCLLCGACCAASCVSFYWSESDETVVDSVPGDMICHINPWLCAMKGTDQPHPRCIALQGTVGLGVWCAIYERRPSVCREVMPSGQNGRDDIWCNRARALWNLPPLRSVHCVSFPEPKGSNSVLPYPKEAAGSRPHVEEGSRKNRCRRRYLTALGEPSNVTADLPDSSDCFPSWLFAL